LETKLEFEETESTPRSGPSKSSKCYSQIVCGSRHQILL